mmetsp:Transcript_107411/g.186512  ORF Transcript_107411/g.186512 Transcript_107411/m.186512 type:complete len:124 (-) Transcript_107411:1450-1821(-)
MWDIKEVKVSRPVWHGSAVTVFSSLLDFCGRCGLGGEEKPSPLLAVLMRGSCEVLDCGVLAATAVPLQPKASKLPALPPNPAEPGFEIDCLGVFNLECRGVFTERRNAFVSVSLRRDTRDLEL